MRLWLALFVSLILAAQVSAATVNEVVFEAGLLAEVEGPRTFHYRFEMQGRGIEPPFESSAQMEVRSVGADGSKEVHFELFEGPNRRVLGPVSANRNNPLVLVFLQRDVHQMANLTGGTAGYFQQQIRRAMSGPVDAEATSVSYEGAAVPATRIAILPFQEDPEIGRFPAFRDKRYEFVVSDHVPGGLYRIATSVPGEGEEVVLEESLTLVSVDEGISP